jgi:TRAP transporter TAXI family solute receptor
MASIWSKQLPHVNVKAEVTGGSVTNVIQVARKESEIGIAMADVVTDAYLGQGRFPEALPLRVLFTAYPNIVHILTLEESGITRVDDIRGRRVSLGAAGSGTAIAAENVLTGLGVALDDVAATYLSFAETTSALKDGTIDAGFVVGGLGLAAVTELAVTRNLHLVVLSDDELTRLGEQFPAYSGYRIPGGTYSGVDEDVQALGIWSAVVVHEDVPAELAYELACTIYKNREALLKVSQVAKAMTLENIHQLPAVPLHPGTQEYLRAPSADCRYPND